MQIRGNKVIWENDLFQIILMLNYFAYAIPLRCFPPTLLN